MEQLWDLILHNFVGCLLVFARVAGVFTFNPILGRQNVPMRVRTAMSLTLAVCLLAGMGGTTGYVPGSVAGFVFVLISEVVLGLAFGFLVNMMLTAIIIAGTAMDNQTGLMMANVMDPGTGIQMPIFSNYYYYLFIFYFFITGGHLEYIKLFYLSYDIVPIGFEFTANTWAVTRYIAEYLGTVFELAMKLAMPVIAAELIVTVCVGAIMKAVPGIQVLMINIQLKIVVGLIIIFALAKPMSEFVDSMLGVMWGTLNSVLINFT